MYRKTAIEHHLNKFWNAKVLLLSPINAKFYLLISLILISLLLAWLIFGSFTRRVEVNGELVLSPHPVLLNSPKSGYISEIFVKAGDQVEKDQALFKIRLKRTTNSGDVGINSKQLIAAQIEQTNSIINNLKKNKQLTLDNLHAQIKKNQQILSDIEEHLTAINPGISELEKLIASYKSLQKKGMATKNELASKQLSYFQQKSVHQNFYSRKIQQTMGIIALKNNLKTQANQFESDILKYQIQKNNLHIRLMEIEAATEFIVNSPIAGSVETSTVTTGQTIHEGSALAQINPVQKRNYKLIFWVSNDAIAWLKPQQVIKVRYRAFPYEKFGQFNEKIENISTIPASGQELSFYKNAQVNPEPNNPLYKVIVSVQRHKVTYGDKILPLTDGMPATATIFLEKRPLYQWIFLPLYSLQKNIATPNNQ